MFFGRRGNHLELLIEGQSRQGDVESRQRGFRVEEVFVSRGEKKKRKHTYKVRRESLLRI